MHSEITDKKGPNVGVCFICYDDMGRFLLGLRSKNARDERSRWDFGGGQVQLGEATRDAVFREIREEYHCKAELIRLLGHREVFRKEGKRSTHWIMFDFIASVKPNECRINEPEKTEKIRWLTLRGVKALDKRSIHSQLPHILRCYDGQLERLGRKRRTNN